MSWKQSAQEQWAAPASLPEPRPHVDGRRSGPCHRLRPAWYAGDPVPDPGDRRLRAARCSRAPASELRREQATERAWPHGRDRRPDGWSGRRLPVEALRALRQSRREGLVSAPRRWPSAGRSRGSDIPDLVAAIRQTDDAARPDLRKPALGVAAAPARVRGRAEWHDGPRLRLPACRRRAARAWMEQSAGSTSR
jgi:hypothetical protein